MHNNISHGYKRMWVGAPTHDASIAGIKLKHPRCKTHVSKFGYIFILITLVLLRSHIIFPLFQFYCIGIVSTPWSPPFPLNNAEHKSWWDIEWRLWITFNTLCCLWKTQLLQTRSLPPSSKLSNSYIWASLFSWRWMEILTSHSTNNVVIFSRVGMIQHFHLFFYFPWELWQKLSD